MGGDTDKSAYYTLFRIMGELRSACQNAEESLQSSLKEVSIVNKYVASLDKVLMQKYNYEFKNEGKDEVKINEK
jgi:hypothetical protein